MMNYQVKIEKEIYTDVLVIGGGPAGFGAAVAAARNGTETVLAEQNGVLGGMATAGLVGPFMTCYDDDCSEQIVKGIFDELCTRTEAKGGAIHPSKISGMNTFNSYYLRSHEHVTPYQSEILAVVMDEMVAEAGVKVLFNTRLADVITENGMITGALFLMKEGFILIHAKQYIDCTGDADAAYRAGVPTWKGDSETGVITPSSLFFEVTNIDRDKFIAELDAHREVLDNHMGNCFSWLMDEAKKNGDWDIDRCDIGMYEQNIEGRWKVNTSRMANVDPTDTEQVSEALVEGRKQTIKILEFMKKYIPGCENVQLVQMASTLGVRESRHIKGKYMLTSDDIMSRRHFDDAICTFAYAIDIHLAEGGGVLFTTVNQYYTIPYRCLVPENCGNLLVAGRCISGTSEAAASYRVMPACIAMGQAAGTAAAIAVKENILPENIDVEALVNTLKKQGAVIKY